MALFSSHLISFFCFCKINSYISTCELVFFSHFRIECDQNAGTWWCRFVNNCATKMSLAHFTTLFRVVKEIPYLRNHIARHVWWCTWAAFCSIFCMQEPLPKVGVLLENLWQLHKLKIHKWVSRCDYLNASTMYSIFDWKEFELSYWQTLFKESRNRCASEETHSLENYRVVPKGVIPVYVVCWN